MISVTLEGTPRPLQMTEWWTSEKSFEISADSAAVDISRSDCSTIFLSRASRECRICPPPQRRIAGMWTFELILLFLVTRKALLWLMNHESLRFMATEYCELWVASKTSAYVNSIWQLYIQFNAIYCTAAVQYIWDYSQECCIFFASFYFAVLFRWFIWLQLLGFMAIEYCELRGVCKIIACITYLWQLICNPIQ